MAEHVKNNRNELEKALGIDMSWLANEMSKPSVGLMTEEECSNITNPRLLTESQKKGVIVNALVRALELDKDGSDLAQFISVLKKKHKQYKMAIQIMGGGRIKGMYVCMKVV